MFLDHLFNEIVPQLCRFPKAGRSFLAHTIYSSEAEVLAKQLRTRLNRDDDFRESIVEEYLVLDLLRGNHVVFLSVNTTANSLSI